MNGRVAWSAAGLAEAGTRTWTGSVRVPAGGWIAARAVGGVTRWPAMDSYPFAHTAPVWIGQRGSRDPHAAREAARDLLRWLDVADRELASGYGQAEIPKLRARFAEARRRLEDAVRSR